MKTVGKVLAFPFVFVAWCIAYTAKVFVDGYDALTEDWPRFRK